MKKIALFLALVLLLAGCSDYQAASQQVTAMGTQMEWFVVGKDAEAASDALKTLIEKMDEQWSPRYINSIPSQLNDSGAVLEMEHIRFLDQLEDIGRRAEGAYSPKMHSVIAAWGFVDGNHQVPTQEQIQSAMMDEKWNVASAMKGFTARKAVALLETMQVERAMLYLGSTVQTFGWQKDGAPWQIEIADPVSGEPAGQVAVNGSWTISTAGGYQCSFEKNGIWYHHLLDPRTGIPAESDLASVTVISQDGVVADAMAAALYVLGLEDAIELWRESEDFEAVFILHDGSIQVTAGVTFSGAEVTKLEK